MTAIGTVTLAPNKPDAVYQEFLAGAHGVVESTGFETLCLWRECQERKVHWEQHGSGWLVTVGKIGDMPVCLSIGWNRVDGKKIVFIETTSLVVDHRMVDAWLALHLPKSAYNERGYVNRENAMNFHNLLRD